MNQKEQVFLNSCELILDEFSIKQKGFIYFVWRKGKKHIQSLKYQCSQQTIPMKQALTLSLKTYVINGVLQKKYTHFSLFDADGRQLDQIKFDVTQWRGQYTQRKLTLGMCNLKIKVRRKVALQLQNFHRHSKTQIQQSSQQSDTQKVVNLKVQKKEQLGIKQQLAKAKRQIEDFDYMTNKLKNDRNYYITQNQSLRHKLSQIHDQYGQQISSIKNHYQSRIQIRESIYQQQIQQLISTFNANFQINKNLIQMLIHQKYDYEAQIAQLKQIHQDYITKQQQNYQGIIGQLQQNKKQIQDQIKDCLNKISDRQNTITDLKRQCQQTDILLNQTKKQLNKEIQEHTQHNQEYQKTLEQKQTQIYKNLDQIQALKLQIDRKDFRIQQDQSAMQHYRKMIAEFQKDKIQMQNLHHILQTQKYNLTAQNQRLKITVEQKINAIQYHKSQIQSLIQKDKFKQQEHQNQYKSLQAIYNQKQEIFANEMKSQHQKYLQVNKQNYDLNLKIQQLDHDLALSHDQINIIKNDTDQTMQLNQQLRQQMKNQTEAFAKQYRQYNQQIAQLMSENNVFQAENMALKDQIKELQMKVQIQSANLKRDYQDLVQNKIRLYEDELDFLKKQRDADVQNFQKIKEQYQKQISALIDRQSKQNQEMQRMFKDQMQLKNKQYISLNQNNKLLQQAYEDMKLRLQISQQEKHNLMMGGAVRSGKKNNNHMNHMDQDQMEIQQIQEQSEDEQSQQSQQDSQDSDQTPKKKKKGKNKKKDKKKDKKKKKEKQKQKEKNKKKSKKKVVSSSQQQSQKSQQSQEQENSQILANMQQDQSHDIKQKNFVLSNQKKAGSQKFIPFEPNISQIPPQTPVGALGQLISIPVPQQHRRKKTMDQSAVSSKKKKKKQESQGSMQQNSKVVKGKEKVQQLEKQIKKLKKENKQYERNQSIHLVQIQQLQQEIRNMNIQMDNLVKKIGKKDPKLARKISNQLQQKRQDKSNSNKSKSQISMRIPPIPRKQVQNMKQQNQYLKRTMQQKNRLFINLQNQKNSLIFKLQTLQLAKTQIQKKLQNNKHEDKQKQGRGAQSQIEEGLKRSVIQLEGKFMGEKQKAQQFKLQKINYYSKKNNCKMRIND